MSLSLLLLLLVTTSARAESYAIIGDAGVWTRHARAVRDSVLHEGLRKLVLPGDNLYENEPYANVWTPHWTDRGFTFEAVAIGNHTAGYAEEVRFFSMPGEYYSRVPEPGVRFIVLNSDNARTAKQQAEWLDAELEAATEKLVFVIYHHPPYTLTRFHSWEEKAPFHRRTRPVLWKHRAKLTALLLGHDHSAILATFNDDLPAIVSGAVGGLRPPENRSDVQDGVRVRTEWVYDGTPTWARLDLDATRGEAKVRFVRASDHAVRCSAMLRPGTRAAIADECRANTLRPSRRR